MKMDSGVETGNESNDSSVMQIADKMQPNELNEIESVSRECKLFSNKNALPTIEFNNPAIKERLEATKIFSSPSLSMLSEQDKQLFFRETQRTSLVNLVQALKPYPRMSSMVADFHDCPVHNFCPKMKRRRNYETSKLYRLMQLKLKQGRNKTLVKAVSTNNTDLLEKLLRDGVLPNFVDESGRTPLHIAVSRGYTDVVKTLLSYSANPNVKDKIGNTPLHLAALTSKTEIVNLLLKAGTNILSLDHFGNNPLDLARTKLQVLQRCRVGDDLSFDEIKANMQEVISMLMVYLQEQMAATEQVEALSAICSRLTLSNSSDQIEGDLKNLLDNLDSLSLKK